MIPSILVGICRVLETGIYQYAAKETYYYGRLISIAVNILLYIAVKYKTFQRRRENRSNGTFFSYVMNNNRDPIEELVYRLQYYPVGKNCWASFLHANVICHLI
jgi:hypothetical protein